MATQGMVTVRKNRTVMMKVVAGCDGDKAQRLAQHLRAANKVLSPEEAYRLARRCGVGCDRCLVVVGLNRTYFPGQARTEPLDPLYWSTFDQPEFNPRWQDGTADHIIVVNLD